MNKSIFSGIDKACFPSATVFTGAKNVAVVTQAHGKGTFYPVRFYASSEDYVSKDLENSFRKDFTTYKQAEKAATVWASYTRGVTVWDNGGQTADRYRTIINTSVYYMSTDANMPNGVCMYSGENHNNHENLGSDETRIALGDLPRGVKSQIGYIISADYEFLKGQEVPALTNAEQEHALTEYGWKRETVLANSCRICGHRMNLSGQEIGWISPAGTSYHHACLLKSPTVRSIINKESSDVK